MRQRLAGLFTLVVLAAAVTACGALTTGRDFPSPKPGAEIKNNATSKAELIRMFGEPTQVGMKDGEQTWTWYYWKKGSGKEGDLSKQLEVTLSPQGVVKSHSFSSNLPEDMKTR